MTFESFILDIIQLYLDMIRSDIPLMGNWWMWAPMLIPGPLYIMWLMVKYTFVTMILVAPIYLLLAALRVFLVEVINAIRSKK